MATRFPYYPYYPSDFLSDINVKVMDTTDIGAYHLLLSHSWIEGPLPDDMEALASLAKLPTNSFKKRWQKKIERCFRRTRRGWVNPRLEAERERLSGVSSKRSKAGAHGAAKRWLKQTDGKCHPGAMAKGMANDGYTQSQSQSQNKNHLNPPAGRTSREIVQGVLDWIPAAACSDAKSFHDAFEEGLRLQGAEVEREFKCQDRGDGRPGRIDLMVVSPVCFGLELDSQNPRLKSAEKLRRLDCGGWIVTRSPLKIHHPNDVTTPTNRISSFDPMQAAVPDILDCQQWWDGWAAWTGERREKGNAVSAQAAKLQIALMEKAAKRGGIGAAVEMMEKSITCGWTGLFLPDHLRQEASERPRPAIPPAAYRCEPCSMEFLKDQARDGICPYCHNPLESLAND